MSSSDPREGNYQLGSEGLFALIGSQRCGTNFFREVMNTNPRTVVHGEIMWPYPLPNVWHSYVRTMAWRAIPPILASDAMALVDDYFVHLADDTRRGHPDKAGRLALIGFDLKYNQLRYVGPLIQDLLAPPFLLQYFRTRKIPIVHMIRRNVVHQALSLVIAEMRNVYHNYKGKKFEGQIAMDTHELIERTHWVAQQPAVFRDLTQGMQVLEVHYEDVAAASDAAGPGNKIDAGSKVMAELARFLRIPNEFSSPSSISKVVNLPYKKILSNHAAVVAALRNSDFAPYASTV